MTSENVVKDVLDKASEHDQKELGVFQAIYRIINPEIKCSRYRKYPTIRNSSHDIESNFSEEESA